MTTTHAQRIPTWRYLTAEVAHALGIEPDHQGATADWHPLIDFTDKPATARGVAEIPTTVIRRPTAAIAAAPHREVHDPHLGVLRIAGQEPARLFHALAAVNTVNTGRAS